MKNKTGNFLFIGCIFLIWLITYIICTIVWEQRIGLDETSYLSTAKGISESFDFNSRFFTVLGILKYGFPHHTHHYPLYPIYLALFFKLFGATLQVAYFSTWFSGLITCIFIYLLMVEMTGSDSFYSFFTAVSFLFLPRIINYCDTAMMEIPGCALLSMCCYFIFRGLNTRKINPLIAGLLAIWLFLFKSLYFGVVAGIALLILIAKDKWTLRVIDFFKYIGIMSGIYFLLIKFVFLPLAPMMNFTKKQENLGTYIDSFGGFFYDPIDNLILNVKGFLKLIVFQYYPKFPLILFEGEEGTYLLTPSWFDFALFWIVFFYVCLFLIFLWKDISAANRIFILFSIFSIIVMNVIFTLLVVTNTGQKCRHNTLYYPLLLISGSLLLRPLFLKYKRKFSLVLLSVILLLYFPFFVSQSKAEEWSKLKYHTMLSNRSEIIKKFLRGSKPMFIYFNDSTHTTWDLFPVRVILQESTNMRMKEMNSKLPKPIEYLFLSPQNNLFKENQDLILKGKPIIDNKYILYGIDNLNKIVVYKLVS